VAGPNRVVPYKSNPIWRIIINDDLRCPVSSTPGEHFAAPPAAPVASELPRQQAELNPSPVLPSRGPTSRTPTAIDDVRLRPPVCDLFGLFSGGSQPAASAADQQIALMEQQQAEHDAAVRSDTTTVNNDFSQFTDDYYNTFEKAFTQTQNQQLNNQYAIAKDQTEGALAGTDQLDGSTGAYDMGQLAKTYNTGQAQIANNAIDAGNSLKSTVNNTENSLYGLAQQAVDPLTFATQAQQASGAIVAPQGTPTLSNVIGAALQPAAAAAQTNKTSTNPYPGVSSYFNTNIAPASGSGSSVSTP
jgi:hypothetical protein